MRLPAFLEVAPGRFVASDDATLRQWRAALPRAAPEMRHDAARVIAVAAVHGLDADAPLIPELAAIVRATKH